MINSYLLQQPKTHLIFDLDDTLLTLNLPWSVAKQQVRQYLDNVDLVMATNCRHLGYSGYNQMINKYGSQIKTHLDQIYLDFETRYYKITPNQSLIDFVLINKDKYTFYIWSNNQRITVEQALKDVGLDKIIKKIVSASDVPLYRPDIVGFNLIYDPSVDKKQYLMIGDSNTDKMASQIAEIDFFNILLNK